MHFNMSAMGNNEFIMSADEGTMIMLDENTTLAEAISRFNSSEDSAGDRVGDTGTVTVFMSDPTYAAEIFERLRDETMGDE